VLSLLYGGQVAVSETTAALLRRDSGLPPGVSLWDLGEHRLRDLTCAERVFQAVAPGLPAEFPPLRSLAAQPNNLPVQLTTFLGRDNEIAEVCRLLRAGGDSRGASRLLTLTGAGGAGKTRLSLQAAAQVLPAFPAGAFFVDLAPLSGSGLVLPAIAAAVGGGSGGSAPPTNEAELIARLNERAAASDGDHANAVLIVLDNCEHLIEEAARVADKMLRSCPNLSLLATSREPLGVAGETAWPVPPLPLPTPGHAYTLHRLGQFTGIALFAERAKSARPDFALTDANATHVCAICRRLDGIPLALVLAAAWVSTLSPAQIEARLSDRFRLLSGGGGANRTALPRQKTLRATMDWSYDLLSPEERILLRRLSVFAGGWTLAAAEAVCADPDEEAEANAPGDTGETLPPLDVLPNLSALVLKSLVVADDAGAGGANNDSDTENRFRLLETIREYGGERLRAIPQDALNARRRHLNFFAGVCCDAEPQLRGAEGRDYMARLDRDHDNVRTALAWAASPQASESDHARALQMAGALTWFWRVRGHVAEGRDALRRALDAVAQENAPPVARVKALNGSGVLAYAADDLTPAHGLLTEALNFCDRAEISDSEYAGLAKEAAGIRANLGIIAARRGDFERAEAFLTESLRYYEAHGDDNRAALLLNNLTAAAVDRKDTNAAIAYFEQSAELRRRSGDATLSASALVNLGSALMERGAAPDFAQAEICFVKAIGFLLETNAHFGIAENLVSLGESLLKQKQTYRAAQCLGGIQTVRARTPDAKEPTFTNQRLREQHEQIEQETRRELGATAWAWAKAEGAGLPINAWGVAPQRKGGF